MIMSRLVVRREKNSAGMFLKSEAWVNQPSRTGDKTPSNLLWGRVDIGVLAMETGFVNKRRNKTPEFDAAALWMTTSIKEHRPGNSLDPSFRLCFMVSNSFGDINWGR